MAGNPQLHAGLASYQSFRPNVYQTNSSSRVSTDPNSTSEHKSHRHHRHRSRNDRDRDHHRSSTRRHAKEVVQSAIQLQPPTSFGDLLKQARGSKEPSPSHSRKGSIAPENPDADDKRDVGIFIPPRRPLRPEDVELERKRVATRQRDLQAALQSLSDQSLKTSRRLDDTYYSILEKVSVLRQTIGTMHELSGLTKELHENFETDTKELVDDVRGQFEGFDNFEDQQNQLTGLEERIKNGQGKAEALTARLAKAKERVDARAKAESEWQTTNTRRLRYLWSMLGFLTAVIFSLILFHQLKPVQTTNEPRPTLDFATRAQILEAPIPDIAKEAIIGPSITSSETDLAQTSSAILREEDERLRVFDEL